jgi:outer membrane lipoprotein-sorting protein
LKKRYIVFIIFFIIFFLIFYYKKINLGNNNIKLNEDDIVDSILSDSLNYKAELKIKIYSNKNDNVYDAMIIENEEYSRLEITGKKEEITGLLIENSKEKLTIKNTKLNLEKIYEDYKPMINNCLFLKSFSNEYRNNSEIKEKNENDSIIIKIKLKDSTKYIKFKELYLNKETGLPEKLIIKDSDKQVVVCIEYTNIEIL